VGDLFTFWVIPADGTQSTKLIYDLFTFSVTSADCTQSIKLISIIKVYIRRKHISEIKSANFLEVVIYNNLTWETHTDKIFKKVIVRIPLICCF
jgi:hypothetical protein